MASFHSMDNDGDNEPGRVHPNESENQPGFEPEKEAQRQSQGQVGREVGREEDREDPASRRGFDDRRKDEVSAPPARDIDDERQ